MAKPRSSTHKQKVRQQKQRQKQLNRNLSIGILVIVALVMIYVSLPKPAPKPLSEERLAEDPVRGASNPVITIVEYSDFGCPTCRVWHQDGVMQKILAEYGDKVQFVWRDFPIITAQSPKAAEAGQCAFDQGKFWEYHDYLFEKATSLSVSDLKAYAKQIGLDTKQFDQCLDSGQDKAKVDHDLQMALNLAFPGTPGFVVNGQKLPGPPMYETLKGIVEQILAAQ